MKIAIASGKGGTGKTTVAVNLALSIPNSHLIDCDVEEPNCNLFLNKELEPIASSKITVPNINEELCTYCGKCSQMCRFNAIATLPEKVILFPTLCHSCGGCILVCPEHAISVKEKCTGMISRSADMEDHPRLYEGVLNIGESMASPVIKELKKQIDPNSVTIIDSPPGTGCPVMTTLENTDHCILVTEPTPFGLHDLRLAVEMVKMMNIPVGVIINRSEQGNLIIEEYCNKEDIDVLMRIPLNKRIAELYSQGIPFVEEMPEWKERFSDLFEKIVNEKELA
ncbi:P-loop NTPase [Methanococcoides sp. SA1]|nr:P-loop NTPase [Methanococcoides sp. SA1]